MAHFDNPDLGVSFDLPDKITVRHQLKYYSAISQDDDGAAVSNWHGALALMENWHCDKMPDPRAFDLDDEGNFEHVLIVLWAAGRVAVRMAEAQQVKKN